MDLTGSYDDIAAQVLAAQWGEWQSTFQPIELAALQQVSLLNPNVLTDAVSKATTAAEGNAASMPGILDRKEKALGVSRNPQQQATSQRIMNVDQSEIVAGARNKARSDVALQDEELLFGSAPNMNVGKVLNQTAQ